MDLCIFEEIISTLAKCGRADLIAELKEYKSKIVDADWKPTAKEIRESKKHESYSDSSGSAEEESLTYSVDQNGFYHLTDSE